MKTYYIYHVPGVKIGCTSNLSKRMKDQGFTNWQILEQHDDIYIASDREIELQRQHGYRVDKAPYWQSVENRYQFKSGEEWIDLVRGRRWVGSSEFYSRIGSLARDGKPGLNFNSKKLTCPHCQKTTNSGNYSRWHGDNCKKKGSI